MNTVDTDLRHVKEECRTKLVVRRYKYNTKADVVELATNIYWYFKMRHLKLNVDESKVKVELLVNRVNKNEHRECKTAMKWGVV